MILVGEKLFPGFSGKKIAIDLTPMLPGGENGGAKWMTLELIRALAGLLPDTSFVLLTAEASHAELAGLENEHVNIQRLCVLQNVSQPSSAVHPVSIPLPTWKERSLYRLKMLAANTLPTKLKHYIKTMPSTLAVFGETLFNRLKVIFPAAFRQRVQRWLRTVLPVKHNSESLLGQLGASLLFCPFTAPFYADPRIPTVSVIYDLQYRAYPQFFTAEETVERENNFRIACQMANHLVAISEFVRKTVIETAKYPPKRVTAVHIGLLHASEPLTPLQVTSGNQLLERYSLRPSQYLLYPANFWQHKNHAMLLTAFQIHRHANPTSTLKLVCTGAPGRRADDFCKAAQRMGLADWVIYPGYLSPEEYDFLLRSAFAMIFPSLYEGFGIPVLEAMSVGVPVLCSNVTSLPEVGGDAVLYFDPRRPNQVVETIKRLTDEPGLRETQIQKGLLRARQFEGADRMAVEYAGVFEKVCFPDPRVSSVP